MWAVTKLRYKLQGSCDVGVHLHSLTLAQRKDEPLTTFWNDVLAVVTPLEASGRPTGLTTLGDIVKLKTLPLHTVWTKDRNRQQRMPICNTCVKPATLFATAALSKINPARPIAPFLPRFLP